MTAPATTARSPARLWPLWPLFFASGVAGLVYESIWAHDLRRFLGHAAFAQVLVLVIFMGGMAIGAALAARWTHRIARPLLAYALCEAIIGLAGLGFHPFFVATTELARDELFGALGSPAAVGAARWLVGAALITPQSILLGATFPLLATSAIRHAPGQRGAWIAGLYFINSLGAACGVLLNVFVLIPAVGLPGASMTAGAINLGVAAAAWALAKNLGGAAQTAEPTATTTVSDCVSDEGPADGHVQRGTPRLLLLAAAGTGLASFLYEIGWIRMLTMVLGGSTHAFELMLSAFILGLAIGGWLIRRAIDRLDVPVRTLALLQLCMGAAAAATLPLYGSLYRLMDFALAALATTSEGYVLFALFSFLVCGLVMLPATVCAGTTLPLITVALLRGGQGERAVGRVYALNTLGSITGAALATFVVMPGLGLKWVVGLGALVDVGIGWALLRSLGLPSLRGHARTLALSLTALVGQIASFSTLDPRLMASGVYRYGLQSAAAEQRPDIVYHRDGATSTVAVTRADDWVALLNNGKPEAALTLRPPDGELPFARELGDERTMVLLGTLPWVYGREDARTAANIGLGSGLTAHTLLGHSAPDVRVDSIEIEPAVVDAARAFRPNVDRLFDDPRSRIHIGDARTHFATFDSRFDLIISEPSNPWVSGVAGLFSVAFYRDAARHLSENGVLVQWVHIYEISPALVASIIRAIREVFPHLHIHHLDGGDLALVASAAPLRPDFERPFNHPALALELRRVALTAPADLAFGLIARRPLIDRFQRAFPSPPHREDFPVLDVGAGQARFRRQDAEVLLTMRHARTLRLLGSDGRDSARVRDRSETRPLPATPLGLDTAWQALRADALADALLAERPASERATTIPGPPQGLEDSERLVLLDGIALASAVSACNAADNDADTAARTRTLRRLTRHLWQHLPDARLAAVLERLTACESLWTRTGRAWLQAHTALLKGEAMAALQATTSLLVPKPGARYRSEISLTPQGGGKLLRYTFTGTPETFGAKVMWGLMGWMMKDATKKALAQDLVDIGKAAEA